MSQDYEETLCGEVLMRRAPGQRHEIICGRLHKWVKAGTSNLSNTRLLAPRTQVRLSVETVVCPDLALVAVPTGKLWLAAEIVSSDDHRADTVIKKQIYEETKLPRLWMIDPRYDNVEVYHAAQYGMMLKAILAGREILSEKLLPEFQLTVSELFQPPDPAGREANIIE
jgi:Uma2 family endonuclease